MIIDVMKLKREGKFEAEFSFLYKASDKALDLPSAKYRGDVKVNAFVELSGSDVFADITLNYEIEGECSRCLEPASKAVEYAFSAKFSLNPSEEEGDYRYASGKIDLTDAVNEALILSAPATIYCKPDCKGLCPTCGANRNSGDCNCDSDF